MDVFNYHHLPDLLAKAKEEFRQVDLTRDTGLPPQKINMIFRDRQYWVYPDARRWTRAMKLRREEGDYFELLSLVYAYPYNTEIERAKMLKRAFHLAGRLEEQLNPSGRISDSLLYWLDPLLSVLRNMVELKGFPKKQSEIPSWTAERILFLSVLGILRKNIPPRIETAWKWLRGIKAVKFDKARNRWVKHEPTIFSKGEISSACQDIHSACLLLVQINTYDDFAHEAGKRGLLFDRLATFSIPSGALELLNKLCEDFLYGDILRKLNYAVNKDDRDRLKKSDPTLHAEVTAFRKQLEEKGYEVPQYGDENVDATVQVLLSGRRVAQAEARPDWGLDESEGVEADSED
ncbi:hypothetical protein C4565_09790 [Candidatus Parcubacteria bacterium]|nr:MAG: hypothetical protein C4565_09790 [Candidatus Parcubacteria bacterium]